jgi:hypothetical protein
MASESKESLLAAWENRPSPFFCNDNATRIAEEITLLEQLQKAGFDKTRDGLSIDVELDLRRMVLRVTVEKKSRET